MTDLQRCSYSSSRRRSGGSRVELLRASKTSLLGFGLVCLLGSFGCASSADRELDRAHAELAEAHEKVRRLEAQLEQAGDAEASSSPPKSAGKPLREVEIQPSSARTPAAKVTSADSAVVEVRLRRALGRSLLAEGRTRPALEQLRRAAEIAESQWGLEHTLTIEAKAEHREALRELSPDG